MKTDSLTHVIDSVAAIKRGPIDSYLNNLAIDPERVDSLWMWTVCTVLVWLLLWKFRERMIVGLEGTNLLWEGGEQVTYFTFWAFFPILFRIAFFKNASDTQMIALWITAGVLAYQITGRYIFDVFLAFTGRAPMQPPAKTEVSVNTEVKTS